MWPRDAVRRGYGAAMTDPQDLRAEIEKYVTLQQFPTTGVDLQATAAGNHAPDEVQDVLRRLEPGSAFGSADEVWQALGLS